MKNYLINFVSLSLLVSLAGCGVEMTPTTAREAADFYVKAAQSGKVAAVESLSTDNYKKRAKKEVGRFQRYAKCNFSKVEIEKESEGNWHAHYYYCEKTGGGTEQVIVVVLEKDGKYLVGDID